MNTSRLSWRLNQSDSTPPALLPTRVSRRQRVRQVMNIANGSTLLGFAVAGIGRARVRYGPDGLWLADGYRFGFPFAGAFTIGDVVLTRHQWSEHVVRYPQVLAHEAKHAGQYAYLGPLFLPAYLIAMGWSMLRTGDRAARNIFERRAGLLAGGYQDAPIRPLFSRSAQV